ncbi:MAG: FAD-dependent oxidoreductase [Coriobacteriia bacterium]|nr:FAD-dependent oxidoreductase [Coriobacteriia bacterium]
MPKDGLSRRDFLKGAALGASSAALFTLAACNDDDKSDGSVSGGTSQLPNWTHEADVVVVGGGIVGIVAAIRARDLGASVIVVEANYACGGHAMTSGGHVHLGGGNSLQKLANVEDSADQYYIDHTAPFQSRDRANIREVIRGAANYHADAFEFMLENGWKNQGLPNLRGGGQGADSVDRTVTTDMTGWEDVNPMGTGSIPLGPGLMRPIEKSARDKGVEFIMNHHMDKIYRDASSGNVVGIMAAYSPRIMKGQTEPLVDFEEFLDGNIDTTETVYVKANKGVVIATGGSSSNWQFHSLFDPRYGPEHANGVGGDPFSFQDASGELAIIEIGGTIAATEVGINVAKARAVGTQYGYRHKTITADAPVFPEVRSYGFDIDPDRVSLDGMVFVNMIGNRYAAEDTDGTEYWDRVLSSVLIEEDGELTRMAGPIWAIFDDEWAKERNFDMSGPPSVDWDDGYIYKADTLEDLADKVVNKFYEQHKMPGENLVATIDRYNTFVDSGVDEDFKRKNPYVKVATPPFYAAWVPNAYHDTLIGVLINGKFQVLDFNRKVIPHLYCGGEASAGQGMHGHGKNISNGYAIGTHIVEEQAI